MTILRLLSLLLLTALLGLGLLAYVTPGMVVGMSSRLLSFCGF